VEAQRDVLPMLDGDLTAVGIKHMKKMGIAFHFECPVQAVETCDAGARVICRDSRGEEVSFEANKVLVAVGRKPNTASLQLSAGGVAEQKGAILVDEGMRTNVEGVYAIGDCVLGHAQLAHTASAMGEVAAENIMGLHAVYDESTNPTCVYMEPEAASVGLTEEAAKAKELRYKVGKFPFTANSRAKINHETEGFAKVIADAQTDEVLGVHLVGPSVSEMIGEFCVAMEFSASAEDIALTCHPHPTRSEALRQAAMNVDGMAMQI
jgi:dihydrolipoamide dehydrogenase